MTETEMLRARVEFLERARDCAHEMIEEAESEGKIESFTARSIEFGLSDYGWPDCAPEMLAAARSPSTPSEVPND